MLSTTAIAAGQICLVSAVSYGVYHFSHGKFWTKVHENWTYTCDKVGEHSVSYVENKIALDMVIEEFEDYSSSLCSNCLGKTTYLYEHLGIFQLSYVIPDKTIIIMDQMESVVFG